MEFRSTHPSYACANALDSRKRQELSVNPFGKLREVIGNEANAGQILTGFCSTLLSLKAPSKHRRRLLAKAIAFTDRFGKPSHTTPVLASWLEENRDLCILGRPLRDWITLWSRTFDAYWLDFMDWHEELHHIRRDLDDGLHAIRENSMRVAVTKRGHIFIVYQEAQVGDKIDLPVVLRRLDSDYQYVGEVCVEDREKEGRRPAEYCRRQTVWSAERIRLGDYNVLNLV